METIQGQFGLAQGAQLKPIKNHCLVHVADVNKATNEDVQLVIVQQILADGKCLVSSVKNKTVTFKARPEQLFQAIFHDTEHNSHFIPKRILVDEAFDLNIDTATLDEDGMIAGVSRTKTKTERKSGPSTEEEQELMIPLSTVEMMLEAMLETGRSQLTDPKSRRILESLVHANRLFLQTMSKPEKSIIDILKDIFHDN